MDLRPSIEKDFSLEDFGQAQRWFGGTLRGSFFGVATPLGDRQTGPLSINVSLFTDIF